MRQKEGIILRTQSKASPMEKVDSIILNMNTTMPPIPANTKLANMVIVYATFSLVKINDDAYVNGITPIGNSKNNTQTSS